MIKIMINFFFIFPGLLDDKRGSDVIDYASIVKYLTTYLVHVQCNKISFGFVCMTASE